MNATTPALEALAGTGLIPFLDLISFLDAETADVTKQQPDVS